MFFIQRSILDFIAFCVESMLCRHATLTGESGISQSLLSITRGVWHNLIPVWVPDDADMFVQV